MARTTNLNDLQLILLSTASQREDGSVLPPPESLGDQQGRISKTLPTLLRRKLISEAPVTVRSKMWRGQDDRAIGLVISDQGREAIGASTHEELGADASAAVATVGPAATDGPSAVPPSPRAGSKIETVLGLLRRGEGATLARMVEATGWLPHTIRAALTGLRKKGHTVAKSTRDGATVYQIEQAAA
jgi:hypothetical protein